MRKPHEERKAEIIRSTLELAAERGVARVTTQAIADRVGIAQPTVFRHFKSRDDIFAAAIEWVAEEMLRQVEAWAGGAGAPEERLRRLLEAQLTFVAQHRGLPRLLFSDRLHLESPRLKEAVRVAMDRYIRRVASLIREGVEAGRFRPGLEPEEAARHIAALVQGLLMRWSVFDFGFSLEEEAGSLWQFVAAAVGATRPVPGGEA